MNPSSPSRKQSAVVISSMLMMAACSGSGAAPDGSDALPHGDAAVALDPHEFSTTIDNPYSPMVPGTQMTFRENDGEGQTSVVVLTVTDATKRIANGVTARVVRDTARVGGSITEDTFDWFAQDAHGTVWYLGEDTATFKDGKKLSTEGSFEAGVDGALAGVVMPTRPKVGMSYRQEFYQGKAEDKGAVLSTREMVGVPYRHFASALVTKKTDGVERDALQLKFYVPGVGNVLSLDVSGGSSRQELISIKKRVPAGAGTGPLGSP